jgi:hypothetical protein
VNRAGPSANPDAGRTPHRGGEVRDLKVPRGMSSSFRVLHRWSPVNGSSWAPSRFCSRLGFLETRNRSIKDGLDGLSLDSTF